MVALQLTTNHEERGELKKQLNYYGKITQLDNKTCLYKIKGTHINIYNI